MSYTENKIYLNTQQVVFWTNLIRDGIDSATHNQRDPVQALEIATALERVATEMRREAVVGANTNGI